MTLLSISRLRNYVNQRVSVQEYLNNPDYDTSPLFESWEIQYAILKVLQDSNVLELNPYYVKQFLKEFIKQCEKKEVEMIDEIYELLCDPKVLSAAELNPTKKDIIKYYVGRAEDHKIENIRGDYEIEPVDDLKYVIIKETPRLISGFNTTGSRTWEASVYLASLLNSSENSIDFANKSVLELGAGTGLLSLALYKYHHSFVKPIKEIIVTDGYTSLIDNFSEALHLNGITLENQEKENQEKENQEKKNQERENHADLYTEKHTNNNGGNNDNQILLNHTTDPELVQLELLNPSGSSYPHLKCQQLWWGSTNSNTKDFIQSPPPNVDILVAADVTYDSSIHDVLCSTIHDFFSFSGTKKAVIAAAVRDERTIDHWEVELTKWFPNSWTIVKEAEPDSMENGCWFKKGSPNMKVYHILANTADS